jgi:hypothetical protein
MHSEVGREWFRKAPGRYYKPEKRERKKERKKKGAVWEGKDRNKSPNKDN